MGGHSLLQGIFLTKELKPGFLYWRQILYHLSYLYSKLMVVICMMSNRCHSVFSKILKYSTVTLLLVHCDAPVYFGIQFGVLKAIYCMRILLELFIWTLKNTFFFFFPLGSSFFALCHNLCLQFPLVGVNKRFVYVQ